MPLEAYSVQGVLFTTPGAPQLGALAAWQKAANGAQPNSFQGPGAFPGEISSADGQFEGLQLSVAAQLGRLDFTVGRPQSAIPTGLQTFYLADRKAALSLLATAMKRVAKETGIFRIASVCNLAEHAANNAEAAARLTELTGGIPFPFDATDCIYQFNVRRHYECCNKFPMNRIVTWGVGSLQIGQFGPSVFAPVFKTTPIVSLKIDVNSATASDLSEFVEQMIDENVDEIDTIAREQGIVLQ